MGQFGWHMFGQPMIFTYVQYSLIFQYSLIHDLALSSSHEKNSTARVAISCRPKAATFTGANQTDRNATWRA